MTFNNFQVTACDTDSIFFKKPDASFFTKEERSKLLQELNNLMPEKIRWELNDYFIKIITLAAKNYVMVTEDGTIKYKGSALKSSKTEPALKEFIYRIIDEMLNETYRYQEVYQFYINEILNVKDIKRWASKKTLTQTTYESARANETKIIDAIKGTEYKEGDKIFCYFSKDGTLKLVENFNNDHDIPRLLKKLHSVSKVFDAIIPKDTFINYALKKNQKLLENK
jgi:hypothetical protein